MTPVSRKLVYQLELQLHSATYIIEMVQPLHSYSSSSVKPTPREMNDRQSKSTIHVQNIPFDMQEKRSVYLEEVGGQEMKDEEIVDDTSADGLDRLVVLLNRTLLSVSPSRRSSILIHPL